MKKVNLLSRAEMRNVLGGVEPVEGGQCITCECNNDEKSCFYSLSDGNTLCNRVCGNVGYTLYTEHVNCPPGCKLN